MANTTVRGALSVHGQNPQFLVETVIRNRIYECNYWKEHCFALTAESLIDKAIELRYVGGVFDKQQPTEFLCLLLKLLQIQPEKEILLEYLQADEFKYMRALAAMYIRMTFRAVEVYEILEPLLKDYRKLRLLDMGGYSLTFMDEFVYTLLTEERACDIILPRIPKREILEESGEIGPRKSRLLDALEGRDEEEERGSRRSGSGSEGSVKSARSHRSASRSRSRSRTPSEAGSRYVSRSPSRSRSNSPLSPRNHSISPKRMDTD